MKRRRSAAPPPGRPRAIDSRRPRRRTPQDNVRVAAAWVVERTLSSRSPVDVFLGGALARYDERDQALLRELVLGTLRWLRRLDHVIRQASNRPLEEIGPPLLAPLRVAAYQLLFLDRVPAHAAVHEAVDQARCLTHRGGASFVNAVLRRIARSPRLEDWPVKEADPVRRLAVEWSHPDFLVRRWVERFGPAATRELLAADNQPRPMHLLAFRDRGGREMLAESLIDEGIEVEPSRLSALGLVVRAGNPLATQAFRRGDLYVQDEVSQVAALLPPPRPGERILDLAAAPGGKSFALLAHEPRVRLVLADVALPRLERLRANLRRLDRALPLVLADGGVPPFRGAFDRVVVDLPCTGTGTLRKNPELKWRISEEEIHRLSREGLRLARGAAPLVAAGGLLVLVSCSLEEEENEGVVRKLLAQDSGLEAVDLAATLRSPLSSGIQGPGCWRLLTGGDHDGFTVHVLRRA